MSILVDPCLHDGALRQATYDGNLIVLTRLPAVSDLVDYTREQLRELFRPFDPEHAHEYVKPAQMAELLGSWKPGWIHSAQPQQLVREIITQAGLPAEFTHYDVPRPRTSFPVGHLTTGVAFAFGWHRDSWYSAPAQQINWWLPVFPIRDDNSMAFDPQGFGRAVPNTSATFDYYRNNTQRLSTARQVAREAQSRPAAIDHKAIQELIVLPAPGSVLLFAGAQLHTSIPNTSGLARYSVDFRTVDARDLVAGRGAPVPDASCTGTAIRDFRKISDGGAFDEQIVAGIFGAPPADAMLVFTDADADAAAGGARARRQRSSVKMPAARQGTAVRTAQRTAPQ
ncbi:MAG: hypothetical protein WBH47_21080 [Streptosporangiaceae bacterium]